MSIFPAGYLNSHKDDADNTEDAIDTHYNKSEEFLLLKALKKTFQKAKKSV